MKNEKKVGVPGSAARGDFVKIFEDRKFWSNPLNMSEFFINGK